MTQTAAEQGFLEFRRTGDPTAMAAVFDALAPKLLLLAVHLTRDRAAAEDVLQETFVTAIQSPGDFRGDRKLLPWLSGIIAHRAQAHLRTARRSPDPERVRCAAPTDPAAIAQESEAIEELGRAIDAMPQRYREVLLLRLHHGLKSREIAHVVGRSPDTVRTQLRRGLEQLRERLPRGLGVPALLLLDPGRGLAAVRQAVLGSVPEAAAVVSSTAVVFGGLLMMKMLLVAAAVAAVVLVWQPWSEKALPTPVDERAAVRSPDSETTEVAANEDRGAAVHQRERVVVAGGDDHAVFAVQGRCVDQESGTPIGGCQVRLRDTSDPGNLGTVSSAASGLFGVELPTRPSESLLLWISRDGYTPRQLQHRLKHGEMSVDLGDVVMAAGAVVSGTLVDANGRPLPGVELVIRTDHRIAREMPTSIDKVTTDAAGAFTTNAALGPGRLSVSAGSEFLVRSIAPPRHSMDGAPVAVVAERNLDTIEGVVVDTDGRPLADAILVAKAFVSEGGRGRGSAGDGKTDAAGRFVVRAERASEGSIRLGFGLNSEVRERDVPGTFHWGDRDVRIVVERNTAVWIEVVDAATAEAIPLVSLDVCHVDGSSGLGYGGNMPRHRLFLATGSYDIVVRSDRPGHLRRDIVSVTLPEQAGQVIRVPLPPANRRVVRVVDERGRPRAGTRLRLVRIKDGVELGPDTKVWLRGGRGEERPAEAAAFELQHAMTDAAGQAELDLPVAAMPGIRLLAMGQHRPVILEEVDGPAEQPLVVVAPGGNEVRGVLVPLDAPGRLGGELEVRLHLAGDSGVVRAARIGADGRFAFGDVSPGEWTVHLWRRMSRWGTVQESDAIATAVVTEDTPKLEIDVGKVLRSWALASLMFHVFVDGQPQADVDVFLRNYYQMRSGEWRVSQSACGPFRTDARGVARADRLHRGQYRALLRATEECAELISDASIDLEAGEAGDAVFEITRRTLRTQLRDALGGPVADRLVKVLGENGARELRARTNERGEVVFEGLTRGPWTVSTETREYEELLQAERTLEATARGVQELGRVVFDPGQRDITREFPIARR